VTQIAEDWRRLGFRHGRDKDGAVWRGISAKVPVLREG
jgi:hypothetical protein